jgi:hypothetical protein
VEALVRVLRVLRVFRIFRLGRRMHSEVQARLLMLACTLAAIIVTAAALFYEIETRFGVRRTVQGRSEYRDLDAGVWLRQAMVAGAYVLPAFWHATPSWSFGELYATHCCSSG